MSLAFHAGVAAVLWSIRSEHGDGGAGSDRSPDWTGSAPIEAQLEIWATVADGPAEVEAQLEQLPAPSPDFPRDFPDALADPSAVDESVPSDELADPSGGASTLALEASLLPPNRAAARAREAYRRLLSDGSRLAGTFVDALARRGERHGRDSGDTGIGAQAAARESPVGSPAGPTRGPKLAAGNSPPDYPEALRRASHEGTSWIHAVIEADGSVSSAKVSHSAGNDALDASALAAVLGWRFEPALENGVAVRSEADLPVVFRLKPRRRD